MKYKPFSSVIGILMFLLIVAFAGLSLTAELHSVNAQIPTGSIPTVTGTPAGVIATVNILSGDGVKVRGGPSALFYPEVGFMLVDQTAPAIGISSGGNWVQIEYPGAPGNKGWVFATYVNLSPGFLPTVVPPASPTPVVTATLNPTLEAQFIVTSTPTRLATFTPAPPIQIPTFTNTSGGLLSGIPTGLVIVALLIFGSMLAIASTLQRR